MYVIRAKKKNEIFPLFIKKPGARFSDFEYPTTTLIHLAMKWDSLAGARAYIRSDARKVQELIDMGFDLVPEPWPAEKEKA